MQFPPRRGRHALVMAAALGASASLAGRAFAQTPATPPAPAAAPPPAPSSAPAPAPTPNGGPFVPNGRIDLVALSKIVLRRSPTLQDDMLRLELARTDVTQSRLWENPALDATWGSVPVGETNPPGMDKPLANIPNYSVGLSYRFLLGKRGPRTDRAIALERSARAGAEASARTAALMFAGVLGTSAIATLRLDRLRTLLDESRGSLDVARARVNAGSGTPLEVDRLEIELSRVEQQILNGESDLAAALSACSSFVGVTCAPFSSIQDAEAFLSGFTARVQTLQFDLRRRPDVRALEAAREAAESEGELARAQAIPDPTFRVGYTYDTFTVAGNQQNSLNFSVSIPLPIVDHGQALRAAADARENRSRLQRDLVVDAAKARVAALRLVLERTQKRQQVIETQMLPRARAVLKDLERAVSGRLIPVTDLIQARRTLGELLLEETDAFGDAFRAALELMGELAFGDIPLEDTP